MSTLTKEWLLKTIAELEEERDATPGAVNEDAANALAAMKIALASLEAEPVCVIDQSNLDYLKSGSDADVWPASRTEMGDVLLYRSAPQAPVSAPNSRAITKHFDTIALEAAREIMCDVSRRHEFLGGEVQLLSRIQCRIDDACRAAMLQGAENAESRCSNSPVIPDGGEHGFCHKHPDTRRLTHPYIQLMTYPPRPSIYCPKCDPNVTEWVEMDKKLRIDN